MIENSENDFSPQQSLQLIESMINRAKDKYAEDGSMYLAWGWLVFGCSILQFILLHVFQYPQHYIVWLATIPLFIYQAYYVRKKHQQQKVITYTDAVIKYVWITFAIVILLLCFLIGILTSGEYYTHIVHILLAVYGMPIFLTGAVIKFKPLIYGGIACWVYASCQLLLKFTTTSFYVFLPLC